MKRFLSVVTVLLVSASIQAQEIKRINPSFEDLLPLLKSAGYELFSFDISSLQDNTYSISLVTKESVDGVPVHVSSLNDFQVTAWNRIMISEFPEEQQKEILANNINVGLIPSADSL